MAIKVAAFTIQVITQADSGQTTFGTYKAHVVPINPGAGEYSLSIISPAQPLGQPANTVLLGAWWAPEGPYSALTAFEGISVKPDPGNPTTAVSLAVVSANATTVARMRITLYLLLQTP